MANLIGIKRAPNDGARDDIDYAPGRRSVPGGGGGGWKPTVLLAPKKNISAPK